MRFEIDLHDPGYTASEVIAVAKMDDDAARTIYFALCNERDKVVADIARYHNFGAEYYQECEEHKFLDVLCTRCREVHDLQAEGKKLEQNRDEDLMFLGEYLNRICGILFEMGQNNTKEFGSWLSV
jgi:hypothetical protein